MNIKGKINELNNISLSQFIRDVKPEAVGRVSAFVLSFLVAIPLFVSLFFHATHDISELILEIKNFIVIYVNRWWFRILLQIGCLLLFFVFYKLMKLFQDGNKLYFKNSLSLVNILPYSLIMLFVLSFFSALHSSNQFLSFLGYQYRRDGFLTYCIYGAIFISASLLTRHQIKVLSELFVAVCAGIALLLLMEQFLHPEWLYMNEDLRAAMFHNNNHFGYYLAICTPLAVGLVLQDAFSSIWMCILRYLELWLIFNAVAYNSVRGSFLAIFVTFIVWNVITFKFFRDKIRKMLIIDLLFLLTILFLNTYSVLGERFMMLLCQVFDFIHSGNANDKEDVFRNMGSGRGELWIEGIRFAFQKPFLGYGPENLGDQYSLVGIDISTAHNEFIQIAASLGIPALICYVTGLVTHLLTFVKCFKKLSIVDIACLAAVGGYLVSSFFGNSVYYTTPYFYMILGFSYKQLHDHYKSCV